MRWTGRPVDGRSCKVLLYRLCTRVDRVPQLGHEAVGDIARSVSVISSATLICSMSTETWSGKIIMGGIGYLKKGKSGKIVQPLVYHILDQRGCVRVKLSVKRHALCNVIVAPRQSEPCLYGRLLFVQIACKCLQFRLAMLLHFFQPPPQPISLALTQHMTKGLHLACRASQRLVGLDQPRPQDAERSCIFDGSTLAGSFNTRACPRTRVQPSSLSRGVELRLLSPAAR